MASEIMERLQRAREDAWFALQPAFDHAIALAKEAEYQSARLSDEMQSHIPAVYPPLVELLAESVDPAPILEPPF